MAASGANFPTPGYFDCATNGAGGGVISSSGLSTICCACSILNYATQNQTFNTPRNTTRIGGQFAGQDASGLTSPDCAGGGGDGFFGWRWRRYLRTSRRWRGFGVLWRLISRPFSSPWQTAQHWAIQPSQHCGNIPPPQTNMSLYVAGVGRGVVAGNGGDGLIVLVY